MVRSIQEVVPLEMLRIELVDGTIEARIEGLEARGTPDAEASRSAGAP